MEILFPKYIVIVLIFFNRPLLALQLFKNITQILLNLPEDAELNFTQIATKYGHRCDQYEVVTEDKYVLTLFNIPGNRSRPVFMMHGFLDSADTYIIRADNSMSLTMARERDNDVWIGNMRGNKYSRHHLILDADRDKKFWEFSFHEIGYYDLPAMIDFILQKTGQTQLQAIGHSEGTTIFYVLGSTRPEYNAKIKVFVSLAPIAYLQHTGKALSTIIKLGPILNNILVTLGIEELPSSFGILNNLLEIVCSNKLIGNIVCADTVIFQIDGPDSAELGQDFLPVVVGHFPAGTSRQNGLHLVQVSLRKRFAQFDYGALGNLNKYKSAEPPEYDLSKVTMKIGLFVGRNDRLSTIPDTEMLIPKLPNVVEYHIMARKEANHFDFVWAEHMYRDLFPCVFQLLDQYN